MSPERKRAHFRAQLAIKKAKEEGREPTYRIEKVPDNRRHTQQSLDEAAKGKRWLRNLNNGGGNYYSGR